jgi:glycosyltransferase involved in cell wall biosynthesis
MPKVVVVIDQPGWAYERRAKALKKHAPPGWEVAIAYPPDFEGIGHHYDVVLLLNYVLIEPFSNLLKSIRKKRPLLVAGFNQGPERRADRFKQCCEMADWVVCNERSRFEQSEATNVCYLPNGVDTDIFRNLVPYDDRPERILWCGSERARERKRYDEVLRPAKKLLEREGFECDFRLVDPNHKEDIFSDEQQVAWYNSGRYVLCASSSEGTPNYITEGVACGCLAVSNAVGNICDWGEPLGNAIICQPAVNAIHNAFVYIRGTAWGGMVAAGYGEYKIRTKWGWDKRAASYFWLFKQLLDNGPNSIGRCDYTSLEKEKPDERDPPATSTRRTVEKPVQSPP